MVEAYEFIVPGPPPRKNWRDRLMLRGGKPARRPTSRFLAFCSDLGVAWHNYRARTSGVPLLLKDGIWSVDLVAYWAKKSNLFGHVADADVDAPISCVLDAMQRAGVIDDDKRILKLTAAKAHDPANPRTWIRLERLR